MRNVLVGLLWLWLLVALGVYASRLYRRFTRPKEPVADPDGTATTAGSSPVPVDPVPVDPVPVVPPRAARLDRPETAAGRSGLFAPTPSTTPQGGTGVAAGSEARPTVADVVRGIAMPCDLTPVVDAARVADAHRVAFSTHTATAAAVGAAVGDELERLGFALQSTSANELAATKVDQRVVVTIHPDPESVHFGDGPAFPTMPPGSVVVEFRT